MNKIKKQTILCLLFCICFCSCEKERLQEGTKQLYILLSMPESIDVNTKADVPKLDDITISNVWIIQFNVQSSKCVKALYVPQNQIVPSTSDKESGVVVNLKTGGDEGSDLTKFSDVESRFYVIANGGIQLLTAKSSDANSMYILEGDELDQLTEKKLKATTIPVGSDIENPFTSESLSLLTSGPVTYTPKDDGVIKVRTQMFRGFARIKLEILFAGSSGGSFSLTNSRIYNLPKQMAMYRAGGLNTTTYPEAKVGTNTDTETFSIAKGPFDLGIKDLSTSTGNTTKTFYMAENLRGVGKSTTQQGKNKKENGPASTESDPLIGCTYIELEGTYKYSTTHTDGVKVKYTFYLGGNFTNDYNIARDYSYDLTFKIAGPNSADVRVQITDGNVAVFDEVDVVDNIVVDF